MYLRHAFINSSPSENSRIGEKAHNSEKNRPKDAGGGKTSEKTSYFSMPDKLRTMKAYHPDMEKYGEFTGAKKQTCGGPHTFEEECKKLSTYFACQAFAVHHLVLAKKSASSSPNGCNRFRVLESCILSYLNKPTTKETTQAGLKQSRQDAKDWHSKTR